MHCLLGDGGGCLPSHGKVLQFSREAVLAKSLEEECSRAKELLSSSTRRLVPPPASVLPEQDLPRIVLGKKEGKKKGKGFKTWAI